MENILTIAAACLVNDDGQILLVRKRGTSYFMQPGGKLERGESARSAVRREIQEELGLCFEEADLENWGLWEGPAANELDTSIVAHLFKSAFHGQVKPQAELEEVLWISPELALARDDIAPLLRDRVLPNLIAEQRQQATSR
ncbi:NUDIX hydrolase [Glutamicibacter endophyticus]|uniref:NUDIX hydrolase n=1 Tax=Glutamicibacter endophyticus TaxID=1522174 RepID=UPI003AF071BF